MKIREVRELLCAAHWLEQARTRATRAVRWARRQAHKLVAPALAIASGIAYAVGFAGIGWWPVSAVALTPLLWAIRERRARTATALGWLTGLSATLIGFAWLATAVHEHGGFPPLLAALLLLAFACWHAGRFALLALLTSLIHRNGWPWLLAAALGFVVSEAFYPTLFPWYWGASLHGVTALVQTASVGGAVLVGLPLALTSAWLAEHLHKPAQLKPARRKLQRTDWITLGFVWGLPLALAAVTIPFVEDDESHLPKARIGIVQGNIPSTTEPSASINATDAARFDWQVQASMSLAEQGAHLVVWPEAAFIHELDTTDAAAKFAQTTASRLHAPLLTGVLLREAAHPSRWTNSALLFDNAGNIKGRYDKQYPLPFAEYLPLADQVSWFRSVSPRSGSISRGPALGPIPYEDRRLGMLICYEDLLASHVWQTASEQRPHAFINLTNDGWFDGTHAPRMHLALAKLRAVEHRRYLVRATNTGISAVIDPVGRVVLQLPPRRQASGQATITWRHGRTLYGLWGNAPYYLATVIALVGTVWAKPRLQARLAKKVTGSEYGSAAGVKPPLF